MKVGSEGQKLQIGRVMKLTSLQNLLYKVSHRAIQKARTMQRKDMHSTARILARQNVQHPYIGHQHQYFTQVCLCMLIQFLTFCMILSTYTYKITFWPSTVLGKSLYSPHGSYYKLNQSRQRNYKNLWLQFWSSHSESLVLSKRELWQPYIHKNDNRVLVIGFFITKFFTS